ncbi:hypothetical protein V6N13_021323 [Hibiscus sabdariffa]
MSSFRQRNVWFFIFVLVICQEILASEGRDLKSEPCKNCSRQEDQLDANALKMPRSRNQTVGSSQERTSKAEHVDEFRPTAPGHSPGAGHWIKN